MRDMRGILRVAEALRSGMVGVGTAALANETAPFGGIWGTLTVPRPAARFRAAAIRQARP